MDFSAASSLLGYLFQCRYALLESLRRLRRSEEFLVSIETIDDVVFETDPDVFELLQTKHHINREGDLANASPDLWKTIRIWCEGIISGSITNDSSFFLITTAQATVGSASHYLKAGGTRDVNRALEHLDATTQSSASQSNKAAYLAFRQLSPAQRLTLTNSIIVIDGAPTMPDLNLALKEELYFAAQQQYLDSFLQRLEGWWLRRTIKQLIGTDRQPILSEELEAEIMNLREQFKQDNLPIDDEIMSASVDASGYQNNTFVHQLRLIEIGDPRIFHAIRNYFRAFEHRSRWMREELLYVGELDRYEDRLTEEWETLFDQMRDELGNDATEKTKKCAAQELYKWIETGTHRLIRRGVTEPSISRGTYQILADSQKVGWHPEFVERLKRLLETQET